ncbi:MAG: hypothetical protein A2Y41_03000 [Spirochaetes bacterium GWB1_36_13]|nr:MAG: hypothetical protein A2Y41_03000 [Spirochaetes bacterium GWB1_36_13]
MAGYERPEAFAKAFKQFHGLIPSECKKTGRHHFFDKINLNDLSKTIKTGGYDMDLVQIQTETEFQVVGKGIRIQEESSFMYQQILEFWDQCEAEGMFETLEGLEKQSWKENVWLGVSMDFDDKGGFTYFIGFPVLDVKNIPPPISVYFPAVSKACCFSG